MVDPDPENEEGTELLREISCRYRGDPMNAIVLTGFGTVKRTRDAFKDYKVFDYVEKGGSLDQLLDTVKNAIDDATKREPENVFVENGEPQSFYGEVASILTDDGGRQSDLAGQVLFLLQSLCDTFSLNPLHVPAKAFTLPQTRGWFAIFPVWSRSLERLLLIVVGTGDLLDPRATQWVARRQWQLTAIGTARSVSLRAACYAVEGATYDDFFDAEI
jgi:hypothetical protein